MTITIGAIPSSGGGGSIGDAVTGGIAQSVLFVDALGDLSQDNPDFIYDEATNQLTVGTLSLGGVTEFHQSTGSPEGVLTAPRGSLYSDSSTGTFYSKSTASGNTGWVSLSATSGLTFKGSWNASTNTPTLTSGVGTAGDYYIVSVEGTTNIDGISDWDVGDWIIFQDETNTWQRIAMEIGLQELNGEVGTSQTFATGTTGADFNIASAANTHTFNIPDASLLNRGALLSDDYQKIAQQALTSTTNAAAWDADDGNQATLSLSEDTTVGAISNPTSGEVYTLTIFANGGDRSVSWNSAFKDICGLTLPTLSILTGDTRSFVFVYDSASGFFTSTGSIGDGKVAQFHGISARDETTEVYEDAHTKFRWNGVSQQPQFYSITTGWRDGSIMKIDGNSAAILRVTSDDITSATISWTYFTTGGTQDVLYDAEDYAATYYLTLCPESFTQPQPTYYITIVCGDAFSKVKWLITVVKE